MKFKSFILFFGILLSFQMISGQQQNVYHLKEMLSQQSDIEKIDTYLQLSNLYLEKHNLDSSGYFVRKMIELSEDINNFKSLQKAYYLYGDILYYGNNYKKSNNYYKKTQRVALQNKDTFAYINLLIERAYIYEAWQKKDSLMKLVNEAMQLSNQLNYYKGIGRSALITGNMYHGLSKHKKALEAYQKALAAAKKIHNNRGIGIAYSNIGMSYLELGEYDSAIENLIKAIPVLQKEKAFVQVGNTYDDLAIIYAKTNREKQALENLEKGVNLLRKYGNKEDLAISYNVRSECLSNLKQYKESNQYLDSCIQIAQKIGFGLMLQKSYKSYAENLKNLNEYNLAYIYLDKYNYVKDSLLSSKYQKELAEFDVQYKTLEKQQEIERLKHKQKLDKANFKTLLISAISLLFFILVGAYVLIQKRRKQKEIAELELEKSRIKRQSLTQELELKNKQLTTHALNMMHKNTLLSDFKNALTDLTKSVEGEAVQKLRTIKRKINHLLNSEKDWDTFKIYFEQVNKDFVANLKKINPDLTQTDLRLATLIRLNMTNKEIASILNITHQSVKNSQYRLKKKLKLSEGISLKEYLMKL